MLDMEHHDPEFASNGVTHSSITERTNSIGINANLKQIERPCSLLAEKHELSLTEISETSGWHRGEAVLSSPDNRYDSDYIGCCSSSNNFALLCFFSASLFFSYQNENEQA